MTSVPSWGSIFSANAKTGTVPRMSRRWKFSSVLRAAKFRFGIIFSRYGISGRSDLEDAKRELLKLKEGGVIVLVITESNLQEVAKGANFFSMLRDQ